MVDEPIRLEHSTSLEDSRKISDELDRFNAQATGDPDEHRLTLVLRDGGGSVRGGLVGFCWGGWLHVRALWISEPLRGKGYGRRLLQQAEEDARRLGCRNAYLDTFSFQARPFYEKSGYEIIAQLPDYPPGHANYLMTKRLD